MSTDGGWVVWQKLAPGVQVYLISDAGGEYIWTRGRGEAHGFAKLEAAHKAREIRNAFGCVTGIDQLPAPKIDNAVR